MGFVLDAAATLDSDAPLFPVYNGPEIDQEQEPEPTPATEEDSDDDVVLDPTDTIEDQPTTVETTEAEPVDEAKPDAPTDDDMWAELELLAKLSKAVRARQEAAAELEQAKAEAKEAKEFFQSCVITCERLETELMDLTEGKTIPERPVADGNQETSESEPVDQSPVDDSWRHSATVDLLRGVKGMGSKKLNDIVAVAPTVGELEDLRGTASLQFKSFKELLPKGCGQGLADEIENRLIDHVAKFSTPSAAEQVKDNQPAKAAESGTVTLAEVEAIVEKLRAEAARDGWEADLCDFDKDSEGATQESIAGFNAGKLGASLQDYPKDWDSDALHEWAVGWVSAERLKTLRADDSAAL